MLRLSIIAAAVFAGSALVAQFSQEQLLYRSPTANVRSVQATDINGDGVLDVLTGSGRGVFWSAGDGLGGFGPLVPLVQNDSYEFLAAASDVDGDGDMDVVYAYNDSNLGRAGLLLNNGEGTFESPLLLANNGWPFLSLSFHDLDLDGDPDLVAGRSNGIHRFLNQGNGLFGSVEVLEHGTLSEPSYDLGDVDGDGYPDLVAAFDDGLYRLQWFRNNGSGLFPGQGTTIVSSWSVTTNSLAICDVDADGDLDVLTGTTFEGVRLYRNNGIGGFPGGTEAAHDLPGYRLIARDIDGDGDADMLLASGVAGNQLDVCINGGDGLSWILHEVDPLPNECRTIDLADLDSNGEFDVLFGTYGDGQVQYALDFGAEYSELRPLAPPFGEVYRVYHGDLNGDGYADIMATTRQPDAVMVGLSSGPGMIGEFYGLDSIYGSESRLALADVDGDGDLDLFRSSINPKRIDLYRNDGTGHFTISNSISLTYTMADIATGDIDGDGDQDLIFVRSSGATVGFYRNNGDGTVWTLKDLTSGSNPQFVNGVKVLDLDGDGALDIAVHTATNSSTGQIRWLRNNGSWSPYPYPSQAIPSAGQQYVDFDFGDMDGDGDLDVLSAMEVNGVLGWSSNNGSAVFATQPYLGTYQTYWLRSAALMDVDGDGDLDAVSLTLDPNAEVAFHANNGNGSFEPPQVLPCSIVGAHWMEPFDFDGDGDMDLLIGSRIDQAVYWMENFFGSPYRIEGRVYYDVNNNQINDPAEPGFPYVQLSVDPYGGLPFTLAGGSYTILCDTGTYTVGHAVNPIWWQLNSDSSTYTVQVDQTQPVVTGVDFGFLPAIDSTLARCSASALIQSCGDTIPLWTSVTNRGSTILRGVYQLTLDTLFTFVSAEPPPVAINGNIITWEVDSVFFYDHWLAELAVISPDVAYLGDTVFASMQFEAQDPQGAPVAVFTGAQNWIVACAYDPNIKVVEPSGYRESGAVDIATEELVYTIHFQNTGTAPAQLVVIRDHLSPRFDLSSFGLQATSHTLTGLSIGADRELVFRFDNILLPDSGSDYLGSQGYVQFRIRPYQPVAHGTVITNTAAIHFDLNPAIITDPTSTVFIDCDLFTASINGSATGVLDASVGEQHQWFLNSEPIDGATGQALFFEANGSYTVLVTSEYGCVALSDPFVLISTGVTENGSLARMAVFPVPASDRVRLVSKTLLSAHDRIDLLDVHGRLLRTWRGTGTHELQIERDGVAVGIHIVRVIRADGTMDHAHLIWE